MLAFLPPVAIASIVPALPFVKATDWKAVEDFVPSPHAPTSEMATAVPSEGDEREMVNVEDFADAAKAESLRHRRTARIGLDAPASSTTKAENTPVQHKAAPSKPNGRHFSLRGVLCALFTAYMVYLNLADIGWVPKVDNGDIGEALRINQYWVMFSPDPAHSTGWMVVSGHVDGSDDSVDVLRAVNAHFGRLNLPLQKPQYERTIGDLPAYRYKTFRWQKYFTDMAADADWNILKYAFMGRFLCEYWQRASVHQAVAPLRNVTFTWMHERHPEPVYVDWSDDSISLRWSVRAVWVWFNLYIWNIDSALTNSPDTLLYMPSAASTRRALSKKQRYQFDCATTRDQL